MVELMHPITIKVAESTYNAAREQATSRGFLSVEEYVSDWLENQEALEMHMTPEVALALEEGLADIREGRVISVEEHNIRHKERRAAWIQAHRA